MVPHVLIVMLLAGLPAFAVAQADEAVPAEAVDAQAPNAAEAPDAPEAADSAKEQEQEQEHVPEVTIGQPAPGTDPLAERERPAPVAPAGGAGIAGDSLDVPESRLRIDPRTLGIAPGEPMPPLLREGEFIRNRDARLIPTDDRGFAVVILEPPADSEPGTPRSAMIVAPNRMLESMEALQRDRGENLRFTLSGQVHAYDGTNYLMVTSLPRPWLLDEQGQSELAGQAGRATEPATEAESPATTAPEGDGEASSDEVLEQLLGQRRDVPDPIDPAQGTDAQDPAENPRAYDPRPLLSGVAPDQPEPKLYEEGTFIIHRSARLVRSGDGSEALLVFDADDVGSPEPPMIVQHCKLLQDMEQVIKVHGDHTPFVVSGQVQTYRGTNYLLPSIAKLEFDRENLE